MPPASRCWRSRRSSIRRPPISRGCCGPPDVLAAMKADGKGKHAFGDAKWWGKELFGIDNALVGNWPVVAIEDGKARIKQYKSIPDWWNKHKDLMIKHMT